MTDSGEGGVHTDFRFAEGCWLCRGAIRVTDPAYGRELSQPGGGLQIAGLVEGVPGLWHGYVASEGQDDLRFVTWVEGTPMPTEDARWERLSFVAAVDSGQCGTFDDTRYPEITTSGDGDSPFYKSALVASLSGAGFGVVETGDPGRPDRVGIVTAADDGVYDVYVLRNAQRLARAICVSFCSEDGDSHDSIVDSEEHVLGTPSGSEGS